MNSSNSRSTERGLTPVGYVISIGGMLLALLLYFLLEIDHLFLRLRGIMGLNENAWAIIGGIIWILVIMAILTPVVLKWGRQSP